jgi:O-acetyl-ADP-ribose deacetylase (regulator of RNase III)
LAPLGAEADAWQVGKRRLELILGDITRQAVDAVANAANMSLRGGGGVDGAIHAAAGPALLDELQRRYPDGTPTGTAVETSGHDLLAPWILHAVGPVWCGGNRNEADLLADAYRSCLRLADQLGARTVAFPAISLGIYGYPVDEGARVALTTVSDHLRGETGVTLVRFVLRDATYPAFATVLQELRAG